jgi:2-keto-4-pentenoate hydratase/2-oxohepta-3-ene-1,7-dioic acid hydratase in catechol pathway
VKLVTYRFRGTQRLGAMAGHGQVVDLNRALAHSLDPRGNAIAEARAAAIVPGDMLSLLELGDGALAEASAALDAGARFASTDPEQAKALGILFEQDEPGFRLDAPVPRPGTVFAIGLNYQEHVDESRSGAAPAAPRPTHPTVFTKISSSIVGPGAGVEVPHASTMVDWEGELCLVIGKAARHVSEADAYSCIAGYTIGNDISVRDWQFHTPTWIMGKGFDTHAPIGPWLVTTDEVDPAGLRLQTWVNGVLKQDANTRDLIFTIPVLIAYLSTAFTLRPGDVIFTGTPAGVGAARKPPEWLAAGDTVKVAITGLGELENPVVAEAE